MCSRWGWPLVMAAWEEAMFSGQRWGVQVVSRYLLLLRSQVSYGHTDNSTLHDSKLADTKYFMRALYWLSSSRSNQIQYPFSRVRWQEGAWHGITENVVVTGWCHRYMNYSQLIEDRYNQNDIRRHLQHANSFQSTKITSSFDFATARTRTQSHTQNIKHRLLLDMNRTTCLRTFVQEFPIFLLPYYTLI